MTRRTFTALLPAAAASPSPGAAVLDAELFRPHVEFFNRMMPEEVAQHIPDAQAWPWLRANIPLFTCPDGELEQVYYYRWWAYRKHIRKTPAGFLITEFLKPVKHAGEYNALSCAFGHHVAEGRWLREPVYLDQHIRFWLRGGENGGLHRNFHQFSGWAAAALVDRYLADGNRAALVRYLDALTLDYRTWERERLLPGGLFWQRDVSDGMEESVSGGRRVKNIRPSINSYMFGNAAALARIAALAGHGALEREFRDKAARLKQLVEARLWNPRHQFFETLLDSGESAEVREAIGFTPWYFGLPEAGRGFETAWKQLTDPAGFDAPYGPTTAERRSPGFRVLYEGDDCQWNGPSWPFATTLALRALAEVLNRYPQGAVTRADYWRTLEIYTRSQHLKLPDGRTIPFVDENLNPLTGEWLARAMKIRKGTFYGRGDHYNHSGYADLIVTGLAGLRPRADETIEVNPLLPAGTWPWFCLDNILYHSRTVTILWDRDGSKFGRGRGLLVLVDGKEVARAPALERVTGRLG